MSRSRCPGCDARKPSWRALCYGCKAQSAQGAAIAAGRARSRQARASAASPDRPRLPWFRLACILCGREWSAALSGGRLVRVVALSGGLTRLDPVCAWPLRNLRCPGCGGSVLAEPSSGPDHAGDAARLDGAA